MSNEWKSIESAPKDGTEVLLYGQKQFGYGVAHYSDHRVGGWVSYWPFTKDATHWQPLPLPPPPAQEGK